MNKYILKLNVAAAKTNDVIIGWKLFMLPLITNDLGISTKSSLIFGRI